MPPDVLARWTSEKNSISNRFKFLQEWVSGGCGWGDITVSESHRHIADSSKKETYRWVTLGALLTEYDAWDHPKKKEYVESLIEDNYGKRKAKGKRRGDENFTKYKILANSEESKKNSHLQEKGVTLKAAPDTSEVNGKALVDIAKGFKQGLQVGSDDEEPPKAKRGKKVTATPDPKALTDKPGAETETPEKLLQKEAEQWRKRCNTDASKVRTAMGALSSDKTRHQLVIGALSPFRASLAEFAEKFESAYVNHEVDAIPQLKLECKQLLWDVKTQLQAANASIRSVTHATKDPLLAA